MRYPLPCPALCLGNMPAACACLGSVPVGAGRGRECPLSRSARRERTHPPRMVGSEGRRTTTRKNPQRGTRPPSLILPAPLPRSARRERTHPPRMVGSEGRRTTTRKNRREEPAALSESCQLPPSDYHSDQRRKKARNQEK